MRYGGTRQLKSGRSWMAHVVFSFLKRHSWALVCKTSEGQLSARALHQMIPARHSFNYGDTQHFQPAILGDWKLSHDRPELTTHRETRFQDFKLLISLHWNTEILKYFNVRAQNVDPASRPIGVRGIQTKEKQTVLFQWSDAFVSLFVCCLVGLCFI